MKKNELKEMDDISQKIINVLLKMDEKKRQKVLKYIKEIKEKN